MALNVTEDAIRRLLSSEPLGEEPIVQVLEVRKIQHTDKPGADRYKAVMSDGVHNNSMLLTNNAAAIAGAGGIPPFSLVRLKMFSTSLVTNRKIVIITDLEVVGNVGTRIGNPVSYNAEAVPAPAAAYAPATAAFEPPHAGAGAAAYAPAPAAVAGMGAYRSTGPTVRAPDHVASGSAAHTMPIAQLSPYVSKWTIKARVTNKTDVKSWNNARGQGTLFSVTLMDGDKTEIRATFFKEGVDRFFHMIQANHVYLFSGGKIKPANKQFSSVRNDYEISFDEKSVVNEVANDESIAYVVYNSVRFADLTAVAPNTTVDVMGIVTSAGERTALTSKTGKELVKRDVTLVDASEAQVGCTLWNEKADVEVKVGDILGIKNVKVAEYNGRSLGTVSSSSLEVNPDIQAAHQLRGWWELKGQTMRFKSVTEGGGGGGESSGPLSVVELRSTVAALKDDSGTSSELHIIKAFVSSVKSDDPSRMWYPACPNATGEGGRTCNKKLTFDSGSNQWRCNTCDVVPAPQYRYIMSIGVEDSTSSEYVTLFDAEVASMVGRSANDSVQLLERTGGADISAAAPEFAAPFRALLFKEFYFSCRARLDTYNSESRVRISAVKVREIDYARESKALLTAISHYGM